MARQRRRWDEWIITAKALDSGGAEIMRDLHTDQPTGRQYEMRERLVANGFKDIDKGTRCRLFECFQGPDEIGKWRALPTMGECFLLKPGAVLRRWKAASGVPDRSVMPKPSPYSHPT